MGVLNLNLSHQVHFSPTLDNVRIGAGFSLLDGLPVQAGDHAVKINAVRELVAVFVAAVPGIRGYVAADVDVAQLIAVDLAHTRQIRDSGLAMLLMLHRRAGLPRGQIRLLNCRPEVRSRLRESGLGGHFAVQGAV